MKQWMEVSVEGPGVRQERTQIGCMIVDIFSGTPMKMAGNDMMVAKTGADGVNRSVGC